MCCRSVGSCMASRTRSRADGHLWLPGSRSRSQFSRITALQDVLHVSPTATTSPSLSAVTPENPTPLGVLTMLQLAPFHCSAKPLPTAQMLLAETAAIPVNRLLRWFAGNGSTVATMFQLVPSQCAIASNASGCSPLLDPAAQTLVGESAVIALPPNVDGLGIWLQL